MVPMIILLTGVVVAVALGSLMWARNMQGRIAGKMSDQEIIQLAQKLGGTLSAADLVTNAGLNMLEARAKINQMLQSGVLTYGLKGFKVVYQLSGSARTNDALPSKREISDASVIEVAVKAGGKVSASMLCVKLGVSVEEAKAKLEHLHSMGVFEVDVNSAGVIVYALPDIDMLGTL